MPDSSCILGLSRRVDWSGLKCPTKISSNRPFPSCLFYRPSGNYWQVLLLNFSYEPSNLTGTANQYHTSPCWPAHILMRWWCSSMISAYGPLLSMRFWASIYATTTRGKISSFSSTAFCNAYTEAGKGICAH